MEKISKGNFAAMKSNLAYACLVVCIVFGLIGTTLFATETASMHITGYGVDSASALYIGRNHQIEVYEDGATVRKIAVPAYRSWGFYLNKNDEIVIITSSKTVVMSNIGKILSEEEGRSKTNLSDLWNKSGFNGNDGKKYSINDRFGYKYVQASDGSILYQMPFVDILAHYLFVLAVAGGLISMLIITRKKRKKSKTEDSSLS